MQTNANLDEQLKAQTERMRDAQRNLSEARLWLQLCQLQERESVDHLNVVWRERRDALIHARAEEYGIVKDADWFETASRLRSWADRLADDHYYLNDHVYHRACYRTFLAEQALTDARQAAREAERLHWQLLQQWRAGAN